MALVRQEASLRICGLLCTSQSFGELSPLKIGRIEESIDGS